LLLGGRRLEFTSSNTLVDCPRVELALGDASELHCPLVVGRVGLMCKPASLA
jgi:hypothetical protein